jgi:hypothetical protein
MFNCKECCYFTERSTNLQRHINNKHKNKTAQPQTSENEETENKCQKCNKKYKTKKGLLNHESKCKEIDKPINVDESNESNVSNVSNENKKGGELCKKLIDDNSEVFVVYCEDDVSNNDKVIIVYNKSEGQKYKELFSKILDIVKGAHADLPEETSESLETQ